MSLIKDLADLVTQLDKSITDRKTRELLLPVKEKAFEVEKEQFNLERKHFEEMKELKEAHANEIAALQTKVKELEQQNSEPKPEFIESHGAFFKKRADGGYHDAVYCGVCKNPAGTNGPGHKIFEKYICRCGWQSSFSLGNLSRIRESLP